MSTRAMIAVQHSQNGPFALYYRHSDGYPTGLGIELMEGLRLGKGIDELMQLVGAEWTGRLVEEPQEAFPKVPGRLGMDLCHPNCPRPGFNQPVHLQDEQSIHAQGICLSRVAQLREIPAPPGG